MMQTYQNWNIQEVPLSSPFFRNQVESFLRANSLRMETFDAYYVIRDNSGDILSGAGITGDTVKCVAVSDAARGEGLLVPLLSHLISAAAVRGILNLKVFTKPAHRSIFESLGFRLLATAPEAILMEKGRGLEQYCAYLRGLRRPGRTGVIVMNANPFTLGHKYLIEKALEHIDNLFVLPVKEERSLFPYIERLAMIRAGVASMACCGCASRVIVLEGSEYQISAATFPTYFLKDLSEASETQMRLDLDLFARHIAPALDASVRFVGSEPSDALTARYNELMNELLPRVVEIPRLNQASQAISASDVRGFLEEGCFSKASALCPATTHPYLLAALAERALRQELDLPLKPGLVCPDSAGAHSDMDYAIMLKGIGAIRPYFAHMAVADSPETLRSLGIEAENAMLSATGGVNTHRGAIFCLGLALNAWMQNAHNEKLIQNRLAEIAQSIFRIQLNDSDLATTPVALCGARQIAADGYKILFKDWLPYLQSQMGEMALSSAENKADAPERATSPIPLQKLLLRIMSTLDDTCVIKRVGLERAQRVREEAKALLDAAPSQAGTEWMSHLKDICDRYSAEGISPGGAADMLSLTIFIDSITT